MCWEYTTSSSESPACHYFLSSFFLPILPPHLAASQSIPINIQWLCTLSSCFLSGTTHDRKKKKKQDEKKKIFSLTLLFPPPYSSTANYVHTNQLTPVNSRRGKKKMKDRFLSTHTKERTGWKLLRSRLYTQQAWLCATRDTISITMMLKHNTIMQ